MASFNFEKPSKLWFAAVDPATGEPDLTSVRKYVFKPEPATLEEAAWPSTKLELAPDCDKITDENGADISSLIEQPFDFSMLIPMKPIDRYGTSLLKALAENQAFTIRMEIESKKMRDAILKYLRLRKSRKTTYKTLRHHCAKRNGRR